LLQVQKIVRAGGERPFAAICLDGNSAEKLCEKSNKLMN